MWSTIDLYGPAAAQNPPPPPSAEQKVTQGGVERGASVSWLAILVLFFVFRIVYEYAT